MSLVHQAHQKLSTSGYFAILGGVGLGISLILPYLQFTFLITISFTAFDLANIVWISIGISAVLAVFVGLDLTKHAKHSPKGLLIMSLLLSGLAGFFILRDINAYNQASISEYGVIFPLNYGIGLIVAIGSVGLIFIALVLVLNNQKSIEILRTEFRSPHQGSSLPIQPRSPLLSHSIAESSTLTSEGGKTFLNFCPNCGQENTIGKPFCIMCGTRLTKEQI